MTTITTDQLGRSPGIVSRAVRMQREINMTFHGRPVARIVPHEHIERERAELAHLRTEVEELRAKLGEASMT